MTKQTKPKTFTFEGIKFEEISCNEWFKTEYPSQYFEFYDKKEQDIKYFVPVNRNKPKKCEKCGHILEEARK